MRRSHAKFRRMIGNILLKSLHQERVDHFRRIVRRAFLESRVELQAVARDAVFAYRSRETCTRGRRPSKAESAVCATGHILRLR